GPEIPDVREEDKGDYRDKQGRIKRQAVRFRLFGLNSKGKIVKELSAADGEITWTVHVANKKVAWFNFDQALDIPASQGYIGSDVPAIASVLRNRDTKDRNQLAIDPGPRSISGRSVNASGKDKKYFFDNGMFFNTAVYLGELRTDANGNLIFLGGYGHSASNKNIPPVTFANNDGWHDDTSDGPVDATIKLKNGKTLSANDGWVLTSPPDFAPGLRAFVSGYDLMNEVAMEMHTSLKPKKVEFYKHIFPLLSRLSLTEWVNAGFFQDYGFGSPSNFNAKELLKQLSSPSEKNKALRTNLFCQFRNPNYKVMQATYIPPFYGDGVTLNSASTDPREWMAILTEQYNWLQEWKDGNFITGKLSVPKAWNKMSPEERAIGLIKANMDETLGGPFHPGCEFTWPMRHKQMYSAPFKIKRRATPLGDIGTELTTYNCLKPDGVLDGSIAGEITRWMAVPWQTDTASCLSAYQTYSGEYLPTFWPARVPNDVLLEENYDIIMNPKASAEEKEKAFSVIERKKWLRGIIYNDQNPAQKLNTSRTPGLVKFINDWYQLGIILRKKGPAKNALFPEVMWVETGRSLSKSNLLKAAGPSEKTLYSLSEEYHKH
ncbi:MAG: hypothetical protein IAF38_22405, partial [Bacteroidia bacterium]|nr:hypothetical protein [Bacteroidia bacterium]